MCMLYRPGSGVQLLEEEGESMVAVFPYFHMGGFATCAHAINQGGKSIVVPMFEFEHFLQLNQDFKVIHYITSTLHHHYTTVH